MNDYRSMGENRHAVIDERPMIYVHAEQFGSACAMVVALGGQLDKVGRGPFGGYWSIRVEPDHARILADELDGHVFEADTVGNLVPATRTSGAVRP